METNQRYPVSHLDDRLSHLTAAEVPARASRQRLEPGGEGGQMLGVRLVQAARGAERQAVLGQEHGALDVRDPPH